MITFLAPYALFAAALLAIPVVLHLFKPRKVRRTPFSSLRWLHLSQQKLARRIKWHQVILFLLRAAFITLLVLALARPVLAPRGNDTGGGGNASVDRFVVLDVSRSMGYQMPGRPAPIELGKQLAADIVRHGLAGDRTAVLLTGSTTRVLGPLSSDPNRYLAALKTVRAGASDTDLGTALKVIRPMLARRRAGAAAEIHVLTDNHQGSWRHGDVASFVEGLEVPVDVRVVDVGIAGAANAWIADARLLPRSGTDAPQRVRVQVGGIGDTGPSRTLRLSGLQGLPEITGTVELDPGNLVRTELELPAAFDARGQIARISIEPGDGLPDDDVYFLDLDPPSARRVLLIEPDTTQIESMRAGFYLRTALQALSAAEDGATIEVVSKSPHAVTASHFTDAGVVLLADVPSLPDDALAALEARVKAGAGVAIFLGPGIDPAFYNNKLYRPLLPSEGLLPAPLGSVATAPPQRLDPLTNIDWAHPLLAPLHDPVLGDLPETLFRSHYRLDGPARDAQVLASIGGAAPAILDRAVGAGRVVVFNTTASDAWSDLPRRKSFVPLIDRLLSHLSGGAAANATFDAGEIITLPMPGPVDGASLTITAPDGTALTPTIQSRADQTVVRLDGVQQPGIYRVKSTVDPAAARTFVVQAGRGDSALVPIDADALKKWWEPTAVELLSADAAAAVPTVSGERVALWPWLVALACLAFLAEMFLVHWLCPRMNPGVIAPVVPRRGMFSVKSQQQQQHQQEIAV